MNTQWPKALLALAATLGVLSLGSGLHAQTVIEKKTLPAPSVEYQGLLSFTRTLPVDLKGGEEGLQTLLGTAMTTFLAGNAEGFSRGNAVEKDSAFGLPFLFSILTTASQPDGEKEVDAQESVTAKIFPTEKFSSGRMFPMARTLNTNETPTFGPAALLFPMLSTLQAGTVAGRDVEAVDLKTIFELK
ncbi:MAG: hypothetical protein U1F66_07195 [bacterium]